MIKYTDKHLTRRQARIAEPEYRTKRGCDLRKKSPQTHVNAFLTA
jgi:hypothetical protein